jgi:hypothetical protein
VVVRCANSVPQLALDPGDLSDTCSACQDEELYERLCEAGALDDEPDDQEQP